MVHFSIPYNGCPLSFCWWLFIRPLLAALRATSRVLRSPEPEIRKLEEHFCCPRSFKKGFKPPQFHHLSTSVFQYESITDQIYCFKYFWEVKMLHQGIHFGLQNPANLLIIRPNSRRRTRFSPINTKKRNSFLSRHRRRKCQ